MESTQYRLGNLVAYGNAVHQIVEISQNCIYHSDYRLPPDEFGLWKEEPMQPMLLTEEWLLRFGFTQIPLPKNQESYQGRADLNFGYPVLWINKNETLCQNAATPTGYFFLNNFRIPCKYVHQLQNLYYCLTGEELKLK